MRDFVRRRTLFIISRLTISVGWRPNVRTESVAARDTTPVLCLAPSPADTTSVSHSTVILNIVLDFVENIRSNIVNASDNELDVQSEDDGVSGRTTQRYAIGRQTARANIVRFSVLSDFG